MRVLVAVVLNLVLVTALTIASVHIQLIPQLNRLDWAYWVHKSLMLVCLAQFTMAAVWAATARGGRFGLWAHGMVLALACAVPMYIGLRGGHSSHTGPLIENAVPTFLVFETHCAIAIGWSGLFLVSLYAGRRFARRISPETESVVDEPTRKGLQPRVVTVCLLMALALVIGYGLEILPIAIGWSGLFLVSLYAGRRFARRGSEEPESVVDEPTGKGPQPRVARVCLLMALALVIGYGREILPMIDHWPYFRDPGPSLWWWKRWAEYFLMPFGMILVPLGGLAVVSLMAINRTGLAMALACASVVSAVAAASGLVGLGGYSWANALATFLTASVLVLMVRLTFTSTKKAEQTAAEPSGRPPVVRHLRNPGVAILTVVSIFFFVCHATGTIDHFKVIEPHRLFVNDRTMVRLGQQTTLKGLSLYGLTISDSGLVHLRDFKDLETLNIIPFGSGGKWLFDEYDSEDFPRRMNGDDDAWIEGVLGSDLSSPITDTGLANFKGLAKLKELDLSGLDISDKGLRFFAGNTNLEELYLNHTRVTGTAFQTCAFPRLQSLSLAHASITDAELGHLKGLSSLESLNLFRTNVTGTGFSHLKGLANLQSLRADNTKFTDMGLEHLAGLTNLKTLNLQGTPITDVGLAHLKGLTNLQSLDLYGTKITDAGLEHLKGLTKMQELVLDDIYISDVGLVHLKGLPRLLRLRLGNLGNRNLNTKVTAAGIADLKKSLPNCEISK